MGIYSHYTEQQLEELRDRLTQALHDRLTKPTAAGHGDRNAQYQQRIDDIRRELADVLAELELRTGRPAAGPIYMV